jgi:O-antigen/teichoic acid export membrane protein
MLSKRFSALRGSLILFGSVMVVNLLNYGYALVLGRWLGPGEYGAYVSFMSLFLIIMLLPLTLQQIGARYAASGNSVIGYTRNMAFIAGGTLGLLTILFSASLSSTLNLPQTWLVGLGLIFPIFGLLGALRGEAQGERNFSRLGSNLVLEHAIKIVLTFPALYWLPNASGAVLATLAALPLNLANVWIYLKRRTTEMVVRREVLLFALPVLINLSAQAVLINSDVLMVNALLPAANTGIYAAVAIIGRIVFYGSWAIGTAVFPLVAARSKAGEPHLYLLLAALGAVLLVSGGITVICVLFPNLVIGSLFGSAYLEGTGLIGLYAFMTTLYALSNIVSNHYLALGSHRAGFLPAFGAITQVVLVLIFHDSFNEVIWMQIWAKGSLLSLSLLAAALGWFDLKGERRVL